jgi:PEGA domain
MKASGGVLTLAVASALLLGCVDRRYVITTDPPGAVVYRNGQYLGATPVDDHFIYYGNYHFTIVKEGYETLQIDQEIKIPWYEFPPIDFFSETLLPYNVIDRREFHYKLEPRKLPDQGQLLKQAAELRTKGLLLGPGKPSAAPVQTAQPVVPPFVVPTTGSSPYASPITVPAPPPGASAPIFGGTTPSGPPPSVPFLGVSPPPGVAGAPVQQNPQR